MSNISKHFIEERIRTSLLKHRGDVSLVSKELDIDAAYIKKIQDKMKREMKRNPNVYVANNIAQHILSGHEQRQVYYKELLNNLDVNDFDLVSSCCKAPIIKKQVKRKNYLICSCCNEITKAYRLERTTSKLEVLEAMREEDAQIVEFAKKMGYATPDMPEEGKYVQNNYISVEGRKRGISPKIAEVVESLKPMERARLIASISEEITKDDA